MKTIILILFSAFLLTSCKTQQILMDVDGDGIADKNDLNPGVNDYLMFNNINNELAELSNDTLNLMTGAPVKLRDEMLELFNPDKFNCNCDEKLKRKIKRFKDKGFVPSVIENEISEGIIGNLINEQGANALVHSFKIQKSDGTFSKQLLANSSPTLNDFNQLEYLETRTGIFNNFSYSLDCTGYLTGVIKAGIGAGNNSIKASASGASASNKSLIVIKGVIYSPLYQAYKNEGKFENKDSLRLKVLKSIISKIPPSTNDTIRIKLNANYKVVIASNTGTSSFNGKAELSASGNSNFLIGNLNAQFSSSGKIGRTSNFSSYKTYILQENIGTLDDNILFPIKLIRKEITAIEGRIQN
jgi:hypothetical protein